MSDAASQREVGPLGAEMDGLLRTGLIEVFGAGDHAALEVFAAHALFSLICCLAIFIISNLFSPVFFRSALAQLEPYERKVWHTNMVTFLPTFGVTYFAAPAILGYTGAKYDFTEPASVDTLKACGMSLGYMFWDLMVLLLDPEDQMRAYGGVGSYVLYLVHHTLSIAAWPYAVANARCVYFVNFFLVSEVTNFNMSLRWFLIKTKNESGAIYLWNGVFWVPLFFAVRIAVIPNLLDLYLNSDWSQLGANETWAARLMLPIPVMLNVYWFWLIFSTAIKFLLTGSEGAGSDASHGGEGKKSN